MKSRSILAIALFLLVVSCGKVGNGSELSRKYDELATRVTKLEDDLHEAKRQVIAQQQTIQSLNERLKTAEVPVDKLAYAPRR
jgi:outer membrane murein-binding lipoprotein Lpp